MTARTSLRTAPLNTDRARRRAAKNTLFSSKTARSILCTAFLSGCVTTGTAPSSIKQAVPEAPCKSSLKAKPVYPVDTLTGEEDIWTLGTTWVADRKARQARELELETVVDGCTKASP